MTKEIFLIDTFRLANCHTLMVAFDLWNDAAYGRTRLEEEKILDLVKQIRARANSILHTCQNRPGYVPWLAVKKGRKRSIPAR